jgi:hypothetical protein
VSSAESKEIAKDFMAKVFLTEQVLGAVSQ